MLGLCKSCQNYHMFLPGFIIICSLFSNLSPWIHPACPILQLQLAHYVLDISLVIPVVFESHSQLRLNLHVDLIWVLQFALQYCYHDVLHETERCLCLYYQVTDKRELISRPVCVELCWFNSCQRGLDSVVRRDIQEERSEVCDEGTCGVILRQKKA